MKLVTIGVYGSSEEQFFDALVRAKVDTFCDIRARRGVRGSTYAFANSARLQQRLHALGIRYLHLPEVAPPDAVRALQRADDERKGVATRARTVLSPAFVAAYERECLSQFEANDFVARLGDEADVVALFCVEREPEACHRSLLATRLARDLGLSVEHLLP